MISTLFCESTLVLFSFFHQWESASLIFVNWQSVKIYSSVPVLKGIQYTVVSRGTHFFYAPSKAFSRAPFPAPFAPAQLPGLGLWLVSCIFLGWGKGGERFLPHA